MRAYALTPLAKADIFDIWAYVADDNDDAAYRELLSNRSEAELNRPARLSGC